MKLDQLGGFAAVLMPSETDESAEGGLAAVLTGLAIIRAKELQPHGDYLLWLESVFGERQNMISGCVAVAEAFLRDHSFLQTADIDSLISAQIDSLLSAQIPPWLL